MRHSSTPSTACGSRRSRRPARTAGPRRVPTIRMPGVVGAVDELLAVSDVELVVVASPNLTHVPLGIQALAAGRHVVVDKPIGTSIAEAERLIEAAHRSGRILSVYQNRRWDGDFLTVRRLIDAGTLGPIDSLESRFEIRVPVAEAWREDVAAGWRPASGPRRTPGRPGPAAVRRCGSRVCADGPPAAGNGDRRLGLRGHRARRRRAVAPVDLAHRIVGAAQVPGSRTRRRIRQG